MIYEKALLTGGELRSDVQMLKNEAKVTANM
jgi:hypothetical protein